MCACLRFVFGVIVVVLLVASPGQVAAQVGGDSCAEAGVITEDGEYEFDTTNASTDDPCFGAGRTVWFRFTAPSNGRVNANTCGSEYDTYLTVYRGANCPTTCTNVVTQNDDWCGDQSDVTFQATEGETYYFAINGPTAQDFGAGEFSLEFIAVAIGDDCVNAFEITGSGEYPYSNAGISQDDPCRGVSPTYWFTFTAPLDGEVMAETCGFDPNYDTFLSAFAGDCPTTCTGRIVFNDDWCGIQSRIVFAVEQDQTYKIAASGYLAASGQSTLRVEYTPVDVPPILGDINGDGIVNVADVTELANRLVQEEEVSLAVGDINGDGVVDWADVQALAEKIVGEE